MLLKFSDKVRRYLALMLAVILCITSIQMPTYAAESYESHLDGWDVQCAWSTLSNDYSWDETYDRDRQPKVVFTYRIDHAQKEYNPGDLIITIPGIGTANRASLIKASDIAADDETSEWEYSWDKTTDTYTFKNKFTVAAEQSVSGGFELLWNLNSRKSEDSFSQSKSPTFAVNGVGAITMEPLSYSFTSVKDNYRIAMRRDTLSADAYDAADKDYIWYDLITRFNVDAFARGLYRSDYYVTLDIPDADDTVYQDIQIKNGGSVISLTQDEDGNWGFYPFRDRSGDISTSYSTYENTFRIGFKKETLKDKNVTVHGHLDRLYNDEADWTTTSMNENDVVDTELSFTVTDYSFSYDGYIYSTDKWNYDYEDYPYSHSEPDIYGDRMNSVNLYNGKIVQFTLTGRARRNYSQTRAMRAAKSLPSTATPSDAAMPGEGDGIYDWDDINWKEHGLLSEESALDSTVTYGDIYTGAATPSNATRTYDGEDTYEDEDGWNIPDLDIFASVKKRFSSIGDMFSFTAFAAETASPSDASSNNADEDISDVKVSTSNEASIALSGIGEDQEYSLVLGDDKLAIMLNNGSIRPLEDEEYDIAYITVPADSRNLDYEIYVTDQQETAFADYVPLQGGIGNTGEKQTFVLDPGIKAAFVRVNGITGSYTYSAYIGVRLHLDWATEQTKPEEERPNHEDHLVNFSYLRALYSDGTEELNDAAVENANYGGIYGEELAERDSTLYGEYLMRSYSNVWLRSAVTKLNTTSGISDFTGTPKTGFITNITSTGTIQADNTGALTTFSLYTVIPDGTTFDLDTADIRISGRGTDENGFAVNNLADNVTLSTREYRGHTVLVADFDCSDNPLEISELTNISVSFPVILTYADYLSQGTKYQTDSYLMVHDAGIDKVDGRYVTTDNYDIDENGSTSEKMAYNSDYTILEDTATEWREYVSKYVKSAYSSGYVTDTVTRLYDATMTAEENKKADYEYRLDFGLGSSNAKDIIFYDHLEQGATIEQKDGTTKEIPSEWQGLFAGIDTSFAEKMGFIPTIYYSTDADQPEDLMDTGWSTITPNDLSAVKSIAVHLDTSNMEDGLMKTRQMTYVVVKMRAPENRELIGKRAVNQYKVTYDAYGLTGDKQETYTLPSAETYVTLLDTVGRMILQKVDADNVKSTDENGNPVYATLTGGRYQVYEPNGNEMYPATEENPQGGTELNSMGRIVIKNVRHGTYYWEELEAPAGYQKVDGRHPFDIDGVTTITNMENHRIPGEVTLTKYDQDDSKVPALAGAKFELYTSEGIQVMTNSAYEYDKAGSTGTFVTDADGTLHITGLPWGNYYFTETEAPQGYTKYTQPIRFVIGSEQYDSENNTVHTEVDVRDPQKTASILLKKIDSVDGRAIKGAVFDLYREKKGDETEDKLISSGHKTNAAGEIEINSLKFGNYYFIETTNAPGYIMPDAAHAKTDVVTLDASTAEQTITVEHTNDRMKGSVVLTKTDDVDQLVGGAEYTLYKVADDGTETKIGAYTTDNVKGSETYGELKVDDLAWGDYFFIETKAPQGYQLSSEKTFFTIDKDTVQNIIYLDVKDDRQLGSVRIIKVDKNDQTVTLAGAEFELYRTDGTKCIAGTDYILPAGLTTITTGADGTILLTGIKQGGYYLQETKAPSSYSLNTNPIRFSVTKENSASVQELTVENEKGKAVLTINKEIAEVYTPFGEPTFIFKITRSDGKVFTKSITLNNENLSGKVSMSVEQGYDYKVEEMPVSRFELKEAIGITNATAAGSIVTADLKTNTEAEVKFINTFDQYEKLSHTTNASNIINEKAKLTSISATFIGDDPITATSPGYDAEKEEYVFTGDVLNVSAFYDDGTSYTVPFDEYSLDKYAVDNETGTTHTITVRYTENGITKTDTFQVNLDLPPRTPRHKVTFNLAGGTITPDGSTEALTEYSVRIKSGSSVDKPVDPVKKGYEFLGWFTDSAFTSEAVFPMTITSETTIYSKWEALISVKYAVSVYGIGQDTYSTDGGATIKDAGLTFGPATGASYVSSHVEHTPSGNSPYGNPHRCIHNDTWEEIIAWSKKDPYVYEQCIGDADTPSCTKAIPLKLNDKLLGEVYPDMTGDGAGVLLDSINPEYLRWNASNEDIYRNFGGWPASRIRATLNGADDKTNKLMDGSDALTPNGFPVAGTDVLTTEQSLLSSFPSELQKAIVPKAVVSDTVYNDYSSTDNTMTTYDKLWLFSGKETWDASGWPAVRPNEGTLYERQIALGITSSNYQKAAGYSESGSSSWRWLRSLMRDHGNDAYCVRDSGDYYNYYVIGNFSGIAPGFTLPGPEPDVKYAVSLYGIEHDTYREEDGTTGTTGLTFGPATGASYVNSYVSHEPTGTTASGNPHRCIHNDNWETIASWSMKDPYVYEQCYGDADTPSCTKAVPLVMTGKTLKGTSYTNMSGDGAGVLYYSINQEYLRWNAYNEGDYRNYGGWPASRIRATLNGADDKTNKLMDGSDALTPNKGLPVAGTDVLTADQSLFSCFPSALQKAIVPKAVVSDTVYNDYSSTANTMITYDKLWLFSGKETWDASGWSAVRPNEGTLYERQIALGITSSSYQKAIGYIESGSSSWRWLRSLYRYHDRHAYGVSGSGDHSYNSVDGNFYGVAPGFSLKGK